MTLPVNDTFCLAPWVQIHLTPESEIRPCCFVSAPFDTVPKSTGLDNLGILNQDEMKNLRRMMLNGEKHKVCTLCYSHEENNRGVNSLRGYYNRTFGNSRSADLVANHTAPDGALDRVDVQYMDIRFSNLCNLRCRMCGLELSSAWYDKYKEFGKDPSVAKPKFIEADYDGDLFAILDTVVEIYFAGGEPTINPNHYKILNYLIETGRTDVVLKYNTNLTTIRYKQNDLIDMWNKFDEVIIGASIDGFGSTLEYIRTDIRWDRISENYRRIMTETGPNVSIYTSPTIGVMNAETLPEFHRKMYELGLTGVRKTYDDTFMTNFIETPHEQCLKNLPQAYKDHLTDVFLDHIDWIRATITSPQQQEVIDKWGYILSFMNGTTPDQSTTHNHMRKLLTQMNHWDIRNKSNWRVQLPHLEKMFNDIC